MHLGSGRHGDFVWFVTPEVPRLIEKIIRHHHNARLCITSFDSGPFAVSREGRGLGWEQVGSIAVSPPLTEGVALPSAGFDEWYVLEELPTSAFSPEVFVNQVPFPLATAVDASQPDELGRWLVDAHARFWRQLDAAQPISYVARAHHDIVVSRRPELIDDLQAQRS